MSEYRQLRAVMFTDIVGFSALMAKDEKKALEATQQQREIMLPLLGQFGGRLHKEIGDGTLCSFDSAVAAVRCAKGIQEQLRAQAKFKVRIGIHIGEIVHRGDDILGDGVNIAARIEPLAPEGGIAVSDAVYNAVRSQDDLIFHRLGSRRLKNIGKPVDVFVVSPGAGHALGGRRFGRWLWALPVCAILGALLYFMPFWAPLATRLKPVAAAATGSIAVLPLKPLAAANGQDLLGLGLADAIISQLGKSRQIVVRPLTAVRAFTALDTDAVAAARGLSVEAVLDGTWQLAGDRLRVNASLMRVADGTVLWTNTFDAQATDIFGLQDQISRAVASQLQITLAQQLSGVKLGPISPRSYESYARGVQSLYYKIGTTADTSEAVALFRQALSEAPDFALARARLAYALLINAIYDSRKANLYEEAMVELRLAEKQDPNLPFVHLVRGAIANSEYGGWQLATAYREFRAVQKADPTLLAHEVADIYFHVGLVEQGQREARLAIALNPESDGVKRLYVSQLLFNGQVDLAAAVAKEFLNQDLRNLDIEWAIEQDLEGGNIRGALERHDKYRTEHPGNKYKYDEATEALLLALQGREADAQARIQQVIAQSTSGRARHHETYAAARIYALSGNAKMSVRWLQETVDRGFPNLPVIKRDPMLAKIRGSDEYRQFLASFAPRWEKLVTDIQLP